MRAITGALVALVAGPLAGGAALAAEVKVHDFAREAGRGESHDGWRWETITGGKEYDVGAMTITGTLPEHRHDDGDHLFYIVRGHGRARLEGREVQVREGQVIEIPKGAWHEIRAEGGPMQVLVFNSPHLEDAREYRRSPEAARRASPGGSQQRAEERYPRSGTGGVGQPSSSPDGQIVRPDSPLGRAIEEQRRRQEQQERSYGEGGER
jgi:quercetin dioxygenase-like cupin family protein